MRNLSTTGERLSFLIDNVLNIRTVKVSQSLGIKPAYLSQMRNDHKPFTRSIAYKISLAYPQVNADWILTGEGEPTKETNSNHPTHADLPQQVNEPPAEYKPGQRISFDDMPNLVRYLLNEVQELRAAVETLQKEVENAKNERVKSAE